MQNFFPSVFNSESCFFAGFWVFFFPSQKMALIHNYRIMPREPPTVIILPEM